MKFFENKNYSLSEDFEICIYSRVLNYFFLKTHRNIATKMSIYDEVLLYLDIYIKVVFRIHHQRPKKIKKEI